MATKAKVVAKLIKGNTPEPAPAPAEKLSQIAAAERVLADTDGPMICVAIVEAIVAKGFWTSPGGKTWSATLYISILRMIKTHGKDPKFQKVARGQFALSAK